jgi:hypothetical protein
MGEPECYPEENRHDTSGRLRRGKGVSFSFTLFKRFHFSFASSHCHSGKILRI